MAITFPSVFQSAIADDPGDLASGYLTPSRFNSGCSIAGLGTNQLLYSTGATALAQSANLTYNGTTVAVVGATNQSLISLNGTTSEKAKLAIVITQANESAFAVANGSIDPWFHINANGVGFVGDGTTIPFWSIESAPSLARELRAEITDDSQNPGAYASIWAKATDSVLAPMSLYVRANNNIYLQAGTSNAVGDNTKSVFIAGSAGVNIGSWPTGNGWLSITSAGSTFAGQITLGASGTLGSAVFGNATSGLITVQPVTGALGTVTLSLPAATDTVAVLAASQAFTNKTYNGNTWTAGTGTLTLAASKTLTANNTLTLAGTDSTTITFQGTDTYVGRATTDTLTNKRVSLRVTTQTGTAPTWNADNADQLIVTAINGAINIGTNMTLGTPVNGDRKIVSLTDDGTARAITWGTNFEASGTVALPTTTVLSTRLDVGFIWNAVTSKFRCVASA